jgi:hypothetical protein
MRITTRYPTYWLQICVFTSQSVLDGVICMHMFASSISIIPLSHRSCYRFCGHLDVSVVEIWEKTRSDRYGSWPHGLTQNQIEVISKWNRIKAIRRAPNNGWPRRGQNSFGHVEKPHFGVSVIWLSKWYRVRNVLLEVMPNWSRNYFALRGMVTDWLFAFLLSIRFHYEVLVFTSLPSQYNFVYMSFPSRLYFDLTPDTAVVRSVHSKKAELTTKWSDMLPQWHRDYHEMTRHRNGQTYPDNPSSTQRHGDDGCFLRNLEHLRKPDGHEMDLVRCERGIICTNMACSDPIWCKIYSMETLLSTE